MEPNGNGIKLSEDEQKKIADTIAGMKKVATDRRASVLEPTDGSSRSTSLFEKDSAADSPAPEGAPAGEGTPAPPKKPRARRRPAEQPAPAAGAAEPPAEVPDPEPDVEPAPKAAPVDGSEIFSTEEELDAAENAVNGIPKEYYEEKKGGGAGAAASPMRQERGILITRLTDQYGLEDEDVSVLTPTATDGTKVRVGLGFTVNLGDMEFFRAETGLELFTTVQEIPDAYRVAWKIADDELKAQVKAIKESNLNKRKEKNNA